jgi:glycolate oxidase
MISDELRQCVPSDRLVTDRDVVAGFVHDEAKWSKYGAPLAVVCPQSATEVQAVVAACLRHRVPIVARGAGTGTSGGANAVDGCVVLSTERMTAIKHIDRVEGLAVVEPGVVNQDLRTACAEYGLWYPPDPASAQLSTIGGNVATNAGGLCCVKYGVTGDYVLGLQVVTGTGKLVRIGRRTAKGVAGYNLVGLLVGSEGTLGIVTEITLALRPLPPQQRTVVGHFASVVDAGNAVAAVGAAGIVPSACELIDRNCLIAVDAWKNMGLAAEANAVLLARCDAPGAAGDAEAASIQNCFERSGATWAAQSTDPEEAEALFDARRLAYPAVERMGPVLVEDVCVPKAAVPEMLLRIDKTADAHDTRIATVAHAGDGNLHPLLTFPADDPVAAARAQTAFEQIIADALDLGGTVTGEHGVGTLKADGLEREVGPDVIDMDRAIKTALDPSGIFNPGKIFPRE